MAEKKPMSDARRAANKKWNDANLKDKYDRIQLVVPKGEKDTIKAAADLVGESVNAYVYGAIRERMQRDAQGIAADDEAGVCQVADNTEDAAGGGYGIGSPPSTDNCI